MTFFKELFLALLLLILINFGIYAYYANWEPAFFFESVGWVLDPKEESLVFIEKITWIKTDHAPKIKEYFPEISTPPEKEAFLFILEENNPKYDAEKSLAVTNGQISSENNNNPILYNCTLVCKDGPVLNWKTNDPKLEEIYKLGSRRELKQPVAGIVVQLLTQKPWNHVKIPSWSQIKNVLNMTK